MILVFKNKKDAEACLADIDTLLPSNGGCERWADVTRVKPSLIKSPVYWFESPQKRFPKIFKLVKAKYEFEELKELPEAWQHKEK